MPIELPPRRRGRPTKAEAAERRRLEKEIKAEEARSKTALELELEKPVKARRASLQVTPENLRLISEAAKLAASQEEAASLLGVSRSVFRRFLDTNPEARDAWEDGLNLARVNLRSKQFKLADKLAPMAIFLGKNMLGQKDVHHHQTTVNKPVNEMTEEELDEIVKRANRPPEQKSDDKKTSEPKAVH